MFTNTETCTDLTPIIERLGLHPLEVLRGNIMPCLNGATGDFCISDDISDTFLEDLAKAVHEAECLIHQVTGVSVCLKQECEDLEYPTTKVNSDGFCWPMKHRNGDKWKAVRLNQNRLVTAGRLSKIEVELGVTITYEDLDGDGWAEVATVAVDAVEGLELCTLQSYVPDEMAEDKYRIKPVLERWTDGNSFFLRYNAWDTLKPSANTLSIADQVYGKKEINPIDLCCDPNDEDCALLATVDVYSLTVDTDTCPAELTYGGGVDKCGCGSLSCISETKPACVQKSELCNQVRIVPAKQVADEEAQETTCQANNVCTCRVEPDKVRVYYIGGCPECYDGCFDPDVSCFFDALYWLALARIRTSSCGCETLKDVAFAQKQSTITVFGGDVQPQGHPDYDHPLYPTIVTNNKEGERTAWGYLKPFIDKGQCHKGKIP